MSRRGLVQALAVGAAAASIATPAVAQPASIVAEAASADYVRDPTRWGSAEVAALFPGFKHLDMRTKGAIIRLRHGGSGPPLLLLHGHPVNHVSWYRIAARLAQRYHVVCADLRGYGDSSLPEPGPNGINYSFRVMAEDMIEVMEQLGHRQFNLVGPRPRRAPLASDVPRSSRAGAEGLADRWAADLSRVDQHQQGMGARAPGTGCSSRSRNRFPRR